MFDHVDIHVSDLAPSRSFYTEALGLPQVDGEFVEWATRPRVRDDLPARLLDVRRWAAPK